jgi:hypothetical protein
MVRSWNFEAFSQRPSWPCLRKELACQFSEIGAPLVA